MVCIRALLALIAALLGIPLLLPIIVLGLPFWIVGALARLFHRLLEPSMTFWQSIIEFNPALGWKVKPGLQVHCFAEPEGDAFLLKTDSEGWRGRKNLAESDIVVFGDSFAFSYGVSEGACFSECSNGLRIKAIGAPGYSMVQELLWMQSLSSDLKGKLVVWFVYVGNDLHDNLQPILMSYRRPFVQKVNGDENWEIITRHVNLKKWPYTLSYYLRMCREAIGNTYCSTFLSQRAYSACEFLIKRGHMLCNQAGAKLVVMSIPDVNEFGKKRVSRLLSYCPDPKSFDPDLPHKKIREMCTKVGVPFISAKTFLSLDDYSLGHHHWNEKGHQRIAEVLQALYRDYRVTGN